MFIQDNGRHFFFNNALAEVVELGLHVLFV